MDDVVDPALRERLRALAPDDLDALLICAVPRHPDPELLAALAAPLSVAALNARLATLLPLLPTLLEESGSPAGHRIVPTQRQQIVAVARDQRLRGGVPCMSVPPITARATSMVPRGRKSG